MTKRSVTHTTFVIERTYPASPARVFSALADPVRKARWFTGPEEWGPDERTMDFRVGGRETSRGGPKGGPVSFFDARYQDIVPDERIVFTYDMHLDDTRISVSLATIQIRREAFGTRLIFTEQGAFLDGYDNPAGREQGMGDLFDALGTYLLREPADA